MPIPDWVPLYPGSTLASDVTTTRTPEELYISFRSSVSGNDCKPIVDWYNQRLTGAGFRTYGLNYEDGSGLGCHLTAEDANRTRTLKIGTNPPVIDIKRPMSINYTAVERNKGAVPEGLSGRAAPQIPDWAPIYPGTTPSQMGVEQSSNGTVIRFQLSTNDTCAAVIDWYQQHLQAAGFRTFDRVDDQSRRSGCDARLAADGSQGRSFKVRAVTYSFSVNIDVETVQR